MWRKKATVALPLSDLRVVVQAIQQHFALGVADREEAAAGTEGSGAHVVQWRPGGRPV